MITNQPPELSIGLAPLHHRSQSTKKSPLALPWRQSLACSCGVIGRPCFARWSYGGRVTTRVHGPGRGPAMGPWAPAEGHVGRAGALAVGSGPPQEANCKATKPRAVVARSAGNSQWSRPHMHGSLAGTGLHTKGPRGLARARTADGGGKARSRRRWRRPLGRSMQPPGALMGPSMGPGLGVSWGPVRAVNEVPLAPPEPGGLLRKWAIQTSGSLFGIFSHLN